MFDFNKVIKKEVLSNSRENLRSHFEERKNYLQLDKNENPHPMNIDLFKKFKDSITLEMLYGYPRLDNLYKYIAQQNDIKDENIYLATGSDLAIKSLFDSCINRGDHIILHDPSYFMYDNYAKYAGADISYVPINDEWKPDIQNIINTINSRTKLVIIENPSGMVGTKVDKKELELLCKHLSMLNILLLIDEAYMYVEDNKSKNVSLIDKYKNVVLSYTLSKAHGLAGARIGYLVSNSKLIDYISRVRPLFEISALSAHAAEWQLNRPELLNDYRKSLRASKQYLFTNLESLGLKYKDTHGNFILVNSGYLNDTKLTKALREKGILIRRPFAQNILKGWLRVTVTGINESKRFILVLKEIIKESIS